MGWTLTCWPVPSSISLCEFATVGSGTGKRDLFSETADIFAETVYRYEVLLHTDGGLINQW
jgi:hypothetical protein